MRKLAPMGFLACIAAFASGPGHAQTTVVPANVSELAVGGWDAGGPPRVTDPVLHFYTAPQCNVAGVPNESSPAKISRAATYPASTRDLFVFNPPRAAGACNPFVLRSNLAVDATHLFWFDNQIPLGTRLVSLPRTANPGDVPAPLAVFPSPPLGSPANEIVQYGSDLFLLVHTLTDDFLSRFDKSGNGVQLVSGRPPGSMSRLQFDGRWVWWLEGSTLRRYDTQTAGTQTIDSNVFSFHSEGDQSQCSPLGCQNANSVYVGKGNQLLLIDTFALGTPPFVVYTAPASRPNAFIRDIARASGEIFFLEVTPSLFSVDNRIFRASFTNPQLILPPVTRLSGFRNLQTDDVNVIWHDPFPPSASSGLIASIKKNAPAAFLLQATGLEVTQGIQNLSQDVRLIENKRTIVRFYVTSGDTRTVEGVGATLTGATQTAGSLGSLEPVNSYGKLINVIQAPARRQLVRSFQFELPLRWTLNGPLTLLATVNPNGKIFENDPTDNTWSAGPLAFSPSPRTDVYYMNVQYTLDGVTYAPAPADVAGSQRHMRRLYPHGAPQVDSALGFGNALHFHAGTIVFAALEDHVKRTHPDCVKRYPSDPDPTKDKTSDRELCASDVVHAYIEKERGVNGFIPTNWRTYGNFPQTPNPAYFTRGYGGGFKATGPSGPESNITFRNYAAHEVGHMLGRGHPSTGTSCGHKAADPGYPYPGAQIGQAATASKELAFLDTPDEAFGYGHFTYDFDTTYDVMGYCEPNRISDYTFEGLYQFALNPPAPAAAASGSGGPIAPASGAVAGDWLFLSGMLDASTGASDIVLAQRTAQVADATPPIPSGVATLELRDAASNVLASYGFSPTAVEDVPGRSLFSLVVPFDPNARELRIVDDATGAALATRAVSATPPVVSNVELPGAPSPVDGVVTVTWAASDADGDPLAFDLLASVDGGVSFRTVVAGVTAQAYDLDSSLLAGGATILRVEATDGVQSARADSAPFVVAPRAPQVTILSPIDGHRASWEQLVTLEGDASDLQDAAIPDTSFVWSNAYGTIGTGRTVQTSALQVGVNTITLTVTNSLGLATSAAVDVVVGDALADPGPALASSPQAIAWHVADAETAPQSVALTVENAGGGNLTFDIASDQSWLTIDGQPALAGVTAPATFTVSADTANAPPGLTLDATISVQSSANPFDVLTIPVALSKGNVFDATGSRDADADLVPDVADNCPSTPNPGQEDADADARGDACDNCPNFANVDQSDVGGVGAAAPPDGIGDACQCGDVNGNGRVTTADAALITRSLLLPPTATLLNPDHCNVGGSAACTTADAVIVTRSLLVPPTASVQQVCAPAL